MRLFKKTALFLGVVSIVTVSLVNFACNNLSTSNPANPNVVAENESGEKQCAATVGEENRVLSVANVYYTDDNKTIEVWFLETPLVYEINASSPYAKKHLDLLIKAKNNKSQVSVQFVKYTDNKIYAVAEPTAKQLDGFKKIAALRQEGVATELANPLKTTAVPTLAAVIPSVATLNTIYNKIKTQCCKSAGPYIYGQCIPFQYVADGCYARAQKMRQMVESYYGYTSYKVFNFACDGQGTLSAKSTLWGNNCCVKWWYHVTTYVYVQSGSSQVAYALDPSMFSGPVSISTWIAAQKKTTCGYGGASQGQVYYTSNAYAPSAAPTNCSIVPTTDNGYAAANQTCAAYANRSGCY